MSQPRNPGNSNLMIVENSYRCASDASPSHASLACTRSGCRHFALTCGGHACQCKRHHMGHPMVYMEWLLEKVAESPKQLPEQLSNLQKSINGLVDGFIAEMQQLKHKHDDYIQKFIQKHYGGSALQKRLAGREQLDEAQATGDCFSKLVMELENTNVAESPYRLSIAEIEKKMVAIRNNMNRFRDDISQLWNYQPPCFSSTLKHPGIVLQEDNTRALTTTAVQQVTLVEPALLMSAVSKIFFKVHKSSNVMVGVGYRNIIQQKNYCCAGNPIDNSANIGDGVYALHYSSYTYSHDENCKSVQLKFTDGDTVSVELDPTTGKLTYSKEGCAPLVQMTSIRNNTTEQVHFLMMAHTTGDVSILS